MTPEAMATAFFIPALHSGRRIKIDSGLDAGWLENTRKALSIYSSWWKYPEIYPVVSPQEVSGKYNSLRSNDDDANKKVGQCFTAGVDSFYSVLYGLHKPDFLVFAHGYDISLDEKWRCDNVESSLREIAGELGRSVIIIRTNLRAHTLFKVAPYAYTQGAALATIGLLLNVHLNKLVIPSTAILSAWGTHYDTDHLWSVPGLMQIIHDDHTVNRLQKTTIIASNPIVRKYLRVCWRNETNMMNCSKCEKCVRTMIHLSSSGSLEHFSNIFATDTPVNVLVDNISYVQPELMNLWGRLALLNINDDIKRSIKRLLARSRNNARREWLSKKFTKFISKLRKNVASPLITKHLNVR